MGSRVKLNAAQVALLSELPESGMGYQVVDITFSDGRVLKDRVVLNSTFLTLNDYEQVNVDDIVKIEIKK